MQGILASASHLATGAANTASGLVSSAITAVGYGQSPAEEHLHRSTMPPDAVAGQVMKMDSDGLAVFEDAGVRHEVLVKLNKLAIEDARHGLKELAALDLVNEGQKKGVSYYHPLRYFTVERPMGIEYFGEIEIEEGRCLHVRCHKASPTSKATYHAIDTRPGEEGGAVFKTGEPLGWFDY